MEDEDYAKALMNSIFRFVKEDAERTLLAGQGEYTFFEYNEDIATQRGMMLSPELWKKLVLPYLADFCKLVHKYKAYVKYHSCGAISDIIDDLIDVGVDILNPIQPKATGMDPFDLKRRFGKRICLHGGLDIQDLLPNGSTDEVHSYVRSLIDHVGNDGGFILAGSHTIQIDSKVENILAAVNEVQSLRFF